MPEITEPLNAPTSFLCHTFKNLQTSTWETKVTMIGHNGKVTTFPIAKGFTRARSLAHAMDQVAQFFSLQP